MTKQPSTPTTSVSFSGQSVSFRKSVDPGCAGPRRRARCAGVSLRLIVALWGVFLVSSFPQLSPAQQINYISFNAPQAATTSPFSNACPAGTNILFCANYNGAGVSFISDFYPPVIDPNSAADGDAGSTNYAVQLTQNAAGQASSMWFPTPQDVVDGFTTWYTVKINYQGGGDGNTADGLAFVIQNAAGGKTDSITGCNETGSGPTALGPAGGCISYGGIDNSIALEMDTFYSSWDPQQSSRGTTFSDNHLALQSCGLDGNGNPIANSPAHLTTPNCLISLGGTSTLIENPVTSVAAGTASSAILLSDGAPHQVVMIYNGPNDSPANYLWVYLDATYNPGTHTPVSGAVPLFSGPFDITKYMKLSSTGGAPYSPAYVGFTAATGGDYEQHELMAWTFTSHVGPQNFGNINVCPSGTTAPAPCSATISVPFHFTSAVNVGSFRVVTQGATGLDFAFASGGTCNSNTVTTGCTVNVTFAPLAPGLRQGAVQIFDTGGNLLASTLLYGTGQAPAVAFAPSPQGTLNTGSYTFNQPKGLATDAAGNLYVADTGVHNDGYRNVVKIAPNGTKTLLGSGLLFPQGVAVDGAGNLFVADNDLNQVIKIPVGCTNSSCQQVLATPQCLVGQSGLCAQLGVAVDGPGNVFIASFNSQVIEIPADGSAQTVLYSPAPSNPVGSNPVVSNPVGIAVDAAGDLFITDVGLKRVVEVPAGCLSASCQTLVGTGWNAPNDVAVDAAGDVFVTDAGLQQVVEVPAGCTAASCQVALASGIVSAAVTVDATGNVYATNLSNNTIVAINRSQPPSLSFPSTNVGSTSGPIPFLFQNIGNQPLNGTLSGPQRNFAQVAGPGNPADCPASFALAPGALCNVSFSFEPQKIGPLTDEADFLDNALNAPNNSSDAQVNLSGTGIGVYSIGGVIKGLNGTVVLQDNLGDNLTTNILGGFAFLTPLPTGSPYSVTVLTQPAGQICTVTNGSGTVGTAKITSVGVGCVNLSYPLTVSEIGSGSGTMTDNLGQIACSEANSVVTGACAGSYPSGTTVTLTVNPTLSSTFLGWGGACASSGTNSACNVLVTQAANVTASFVNPNFGNINVCPAAQSGPAPCSATVPVTYNLATTTTIGAIKVVTQGIAGLDFSLGSGSSCIGTITGGNSCTVNVTFAPLAPGLRMGSVQLYDNNANLVESTPVYGIGQGPVTAFGPGTQATLAANLSSGASGVKVDASGNVFVAGGGGTVTKLTPSGVQSTIPVNGVGSVGIYDLALDGAGDIYVADTSNNRVVRITPGGAQTTVPTTGLGKPTGVAVDGSGNLFVTDITNNQVIKITPGGVQTTVPTVGVVHPYYPAVDAAGDVFILDSGHRRVVEVTPGGVQSTVPISGLLAGNGVAVDAAGDVFVTDQIANVVLEITPSGVQTRVPTSGLNIPARLTVDALGDVFIADNALASVVELKRAQLPSLSFAQTNVGNSSSPLSVSLQNVGNQPLTGSLALNLGGSFTQTASPDCSTAFPLAPGAICSDTFSFSPQSAAFFSGAGVLTDNDLNISSVTETITLSGTGATNGMAGLATVPNVVGQTQSAAPSPIATAGLALGTVSTASSQSVASGSIISQSPAAGTQVAVGTAVNLLVSTGLPQPNAPDPLSLNNNYFLTGDYVSAGVTLRGTGKNGTATGTINIPNYRVSTTGGVPDGVDIIDAFLYWETLENTAFASSTTGTFNGYSIVGQQIGNDLPNYVDGQFTGTIRAYRASVNVYLPVGANGIRIVSGAYTVSLPDGGTALPLTEGASLVMVYRVLSPNFPLKSVVLYDGSAAPTVAGSQVVQGFYDAVGGANGTGKNTNLFASGGVWNNSVNSVALGKSNQYSAPLNAASAYAAVILSTPVNNSDNDGILDAWKTGPTGSDFHAGQPGYYDVKTATWVGLPGAKHGQKDLFVQLDYMCGAVLSTGACDPTQENLFPSPDVNGNDPLAMVQQAFANSGVQLHLQIGNAVPEDTCVDGTSSQLCQFPGQPGVVGWKNSLEFSKLYPRNLLACLTGGDCTTRFPYGQKDSYHYVLMGHSLAIPAWNTRYGTLTSITVANGVTTIGTVDRGTGINACPSRITLAGVIGNPSLNGVYNTTGCADTKTITVATAGVPNWSYPNATLPEPVIGLTSGTISSISGYSDLGGADSAVTLGLWLSAKNQDMSKKSNVLAGTIFHEIGHTLGLTHGGLYYDTPNSYVPTFDANCKPNYQSVMNYLFQLDGVGPNQTVAFSNQTLATLNENTAGSVTQLTDGLGNAATFPTSAWYVPYTTGSPVTPATLHCDGTPLNGESGYRVDGPIAPVTPAWSNGQDLSFIGTLQSAERGFNDLTNLDLRQVGATGGEFASLASVLSFGSSVAPLNIGANGNVTLGSGGTVALGSGGTVTLGSGGNVTLGSGGTITLGSGGNVTLGSGGNVTLGSGGTIALGSGGTVALGSGGNVTLGSGGTITLGSGGNVTLGSGGNVTLGSGGVIALGSGGSITVPSTGGSYSIDANGGTITLGSGGNVTLGSGGNVTLGSGGVIALGSGGNVTLGSGGNVTLGSGGTITLGSGGTIALGSGGNVTLGSGGTITLGSGGTVSLGSGGNVTLGSGGTVTLGSGGNVALGSGGNVTLGSGGAATLGAGGTVTLGSGGNVTLGSGGNVTLGSGGTIALGSGGNVTLGSGGNVTLGSGGVIALGSGGTVTLGSGGTVTLGSGGNITLGSGGVPTPVSAGTYTLGSGGTVTLGSGGNVTLGSGGNITLGSGGTITLGSGGNVTLGSGGNVTLGSGGTITLGSGGTVTLGSGGNVTLGSGGVVTLGSGGSVIEGVGSTIGLGTVNNITPANGGPQAANELTYETANSVVRPPTAPTETSTPAGVRITWKAPAFGVVQTYTIYRSSDGATPIVIGSVSGVNGNPPATEFTDTNPDLSAKTVVYTVTTTLVPDTTGSQRQSVPSIPAVLKNDQSITLGPLPSSVTITNPPTVTATALSGGVPNGLQVVFSATGSCAIGNQSVANNVSSAIVTLTTAGSCTVIASQPGTTAFNAANSVSGTFLVLPQGSSTQSQTINFPLLPNAQYGGSFSLNATSSSGLPISFAASGPCTNAGVIKGIGVCTITASAAGNSTYSAASLTQSFTIYPAVLKVTATNLSISYGQPLPALTYAYTGFVNNDPTTVVSGAPALSTTATSTSNAGVYPITVSTGTLATTNYSFLYVTGTLTVQPASQTILFTTNPPANAAYNSSFTVRATGGASGNAVTFTSAGSCSNSGATYKMTSGTGTCSVIASQAGSLNFAAAQVTKTANAVPATPVITWSAPAAIVVGNPLSATQLDAMASVPGSFVYTPKLGTVLGVGASQTLSVTFTPADTVDYTSATASVQLTVNAATVTMGISNTTQTYQQWTNFVIGPIYTGSRVPTGTVTLYDNGAAVTTLTLGGDGKAYYTANPFNAGVNVLTATYGGNSYFPAGASSPVTITVLPAPVNFQASCYGAQVYGSTYQCTVNVSASTSVQPGGVITYSFDGGTAVSVPIVTGNAPFTLPTIPNAGNHTLVLSYAAQGNFAAAGPITKTFTTQQGQTQILATPSSYYLATGSSLTISGTVSTPSSGTPTGSVTVYDGSPAIGPATIGNTGAISYKVTSIAKGSHSYYIGYAGSSNYSATNSASFTVTAN